MLVVTLLNEKGGVGKTTLSVHLAAWLAMVGHNVLLIDSDPQGNATVSLGHVKEPGLYDLLVRGAAFRDVVRVVSPEIYDMPDTPSKGRLILLPSNTETRAIANQISNAFEMRQRLDEVQGYFDYVIFDTSPTPSLLHGAIYLATNGIVYPTECEYLSFTGLNESMAHRQAADQQRATFNLPQIHTLGVVPMKYRSSTLEHQENLAELQAAYGDLVWKPVRQRTVWTEATRVHRTVWNYEPNGAATAEAIDIMQRAQEIFENVQT